jgi:hypothetical protein
MDIANRIGHQRVAQACARAAQQLEERIALVNRMAPQARHRSASLLKRFTGEDFGVDVDRWRQWWMDYNEVYHDGERPLIESDRRIAVGAACISCFPRGTQIRTQMGLTPIEQIQAGDLVLSQDIETGELAYRPVLQTTIRPPTSMRKVHLGNEVVTATAGHPFWVNGKGWRMAKRLEVGDFVHTLSGSQRIEQIEQPSDDEAFNFVVGDFHTYFVGETGMLVHDNVFRQPTTALVPGLHGQ